MLAHHLILHFFLQWWELTGKKGVESWIHHQKNHHDETNKTLKTNFDCKPNIYGYGVPNYNNSTTIPSPNIVFKKEDAIGRISSEVVALCPPGISILLPGEIIKEEHMPYLFTYDKLEVIRE